MVAAVAAVGQHHKQHHYHNPNRPPNRNQIFDSSGPDVRVRGNAHQVFDKYQALAREAAASGDRIMAEAYWQYADHYFRMIQTMGGFVQRNNQGWGEGRGRPAAAGNPQQQQGQPDGPQQPNGDANGDAPEEQPATTASRTIVRAVARSGAVVTSEAVVTSAVAVTNGAAVTNGVAARNAVAATSVAVARSAVAAKSVVAARSAVAVTSAATAIPAWAASPSCKAAVQPANPDPAADDQPDVPEFAPAGAGRRS